MNHNQSFSIAKTGKNEPEWIYKSLVKQEPLFADQKDFEPVVGFIMRHYGLVEGGRIVLGAMHLPSVQGKLKVVFDWLIDMIYPVSRPDFLMIVDADWREEATPLQREILIYHEMCHMELKRNSDGDIVMNDETGRPKWKLRGHDVEEFTAVVEKYGAWSAEIDGFVDAVNQYKKTNQKRTKK